MGLFGGTTGGSYVAAQRAGHHGAAQGAGVAVLMLVAGVIAFVIAYQSTTNVAINSTTIVWAVAVLLLGPAVGLAARR